MDMSGAMPRSAWIEVEDRQGSIIGKYPSRIDGGSIVTDLPGFAPGLVAAFVHCHEEVDGSIDRHREEEPGRHEVPLTLVEEIG